MGGAGEGGGGEGGGLGAMLPCPVMVARPYVAELTVQAVGSALYALLGQVSSP